MYYCLLGYDANVVFSVVTNISRELTASIFYPEDESAKFLQNTEDMISSYEILLTTYKTPMCPNPHNQNPSSVNDISYKLPYTVTYQSSNLRMPELVMQMAWS